MDRETQIGVACCVALTVAGLALAVYAVWYGQSMRKELRAYMAAVPRSVFDPAEQL